MRTTLKEIKTAIWKDKKIHYVPKRGTSFIFGREHENITVEVPVGLEFYVLTDEQNSAPKFKEDEFNFLKIKCVSGTKRTDHCRKCAFYNRDRSGYCSVGIVRNHQSLDLLCQSCDRKDKQEVHFEEVK